MGEPLPISFITIDFTLHSLLEIEFDDKIN